MSNENDVVEDVVTVPDFVEVKDDQGNDTTDWKALALERQELAKKNQGIAQRFKTKFEKTKEKPEEKPIEKKSKKSDELDWGQKAYLKSSGIEPTEFDFVKSQLESSGKDIDYLLTNPYFQAELKGIRDAKSVAKATPGASRTADTPSGTKVDYWIAKGELPSDKALRAEVVERKMELARQGNQPK